MKTTIKFFIIGMLLTLMLSACSDIFGPGATEGGNGNVTITIDDGQRGRTLRPGGITNASAFERMELEFIKDGGVKILTLNKGATSGTTSLETGTWNINARGFMKIEDREYEAAWGSATVTVSSTPQNVTIALQTGILGDKPGVFSYNIGFPGTLTVTEAVLEINPLPDRFGYEIITVGKTVDLTQEKTGFFDLLPGYYLLTLSAKTGATMAIWNELVHIYSGQETAASHTFEVTDFSGTLTLSGFVRGGEFDGNHITSAVVTAYGDENYLNRIASVEVPSFSKMTVAPYEFRGTWSMTVPGSLFGKNVYFCVEETLSGPAGTRTNIWDEGREFPVTVSGNVFNINLGASYVWYKYMIYTVNNNAVDYTVADDGSVMVTTTENVANEWEDWYQNVGFSFPAENGIRYAYEFEAWTASGSRPVTVQYILNNKYEIYKKEHITINATRQSFTVISEYRHDPDVSRHLEFQIGHPTIKGTFYLKIKSIRPASEYIPPAVGGTPRLTATAADGGIKLKADLRGLPDELRGLMLFDEGTRTYFSTGWVWNSDYPDFYEILFPYVQAGKEYTFRLEYMLDGFAMGYPRATATATGGRGEFVFANASELAVIKEGNTVKFNKAPVLSSFDDRNAADKRYVLQVVGGTSWADPLAEWKYSHDLVNASEPVDLIEVLQDLPEWIDISGFLGKTCFADIFYAFTYDSNDIYLEGHPTGERGVFNIGAIGSTPFTYPNVLPGAFTATSHAEGILLRVDRTQIPAAATALRFLPLNDNATQCYVGSYEWENDWGKLYGENIVEIIYPCVQSGKAYTFQVEYEGTGAWGQATATAGGGLGELYITNPANLGLIYKNKTQTLSFTEKPTASIAYNSNPNIEKAFWDWQFYKGYNWTGFEWKGNIEVNEPVTLVGPLVIDGTFDPFVGSDLSETVVFANVNYSIVYRDWTFATPVATSPSFRFPYFEHVERVETEIRTAFDTNGDLSLGYGGSVMQGDSLQFTVYYYGNDSISSCDWFIDGVLLPVDMNWDDWYAYAYLPTTGLSPGMHYGLLVVTIDGAAYSKEFAFRVME